MFSICDVIWYLELVLSCVSGKDGFQRRRILPRTLHKLASTKPTDKLRDDVAELLEQAVQSCADDGEHGNAVEDILDTLLSADQQSAYQNAARLQSSSRYFNHSGTLDIVHATGVFMIPIDRALGKLFERSKQQFLIKMAADEGQRQKAMSKFFDA